MEVPESVLSGQPPGTALMWRVEAAMADGGTVESAAVELVLQ